MGVFDFLKVEKAPKYSKAIKRIAVYKRAKYIKFRGGHAEVGEPKEMKRVKNVGWTFFNAKNYIGDKSNQNLLIIGVAGQGKSKLMRLMLEMMPNPKTIFSFKERDEYLQIEGNMVYADKSLPNPFADPDAFTSAFAVACNIGSEGIQANIAISVARRLAEESSSWKGFIQNARKLEKAKDNNTRAAATYIIHKTANFIYSPHQIELDLDKTNVLDFSCLNEEAKTFYAELFLRQLYKSVRERPPEAPKLIICVDEAHRLVKNIDTRHASIFGEMSREVRAFGMLWTATQNLTDLPDAVRNQFATQFCFSTTSQADMGALGSINQNLAKCASDLRKHEFIDAKTAKVHDEVWIYRADISVLSEKAIEVRAPMRKTSTEGSEKAATVPFPPAEDRPTATTHAALLAISENKEGKLADMAKWLINAKFVTSPTTIYGNKTRDGVFEAAVKQGLAKKTDIGYALTDKGAMWVEPERILENESSMGSDLHRRLLIKTIKLLHEKNMLVVADKQKDAYDLIAYPVDSKKKYLWDDKNRMGYEIQTSARNDSIMENAKKKGKYGIPITWVTYDKEILEEIKKLTDNKDEYLLVRV